MTRTSARIRSQCRQNVALGDALHSAADLYALYLAADSRADRLRIAGEIDRLQSWQERHNFKDGCHYRATITGNYGQPQG